jgi:hypothetical protein
VSVLADLFRGAAAALPDKDIRFNQKNNDIDGLRGQIIAIRSKINDTIADLEGEFVQPSSASHISNLGTPDPKRVFVVHGRNERIRVAMFTLGREQASRPY